LITLHLFTYGINTQIMIFSLRAYIQDGIKLIRCLNPTRIINYIAILISYWFSLISRQPHVWAGPFSVSIETSAICNLRCPECATGVGKTSRREKLADGQFISDKLLLHKNSAFYCNLYFQGEPFLHPQIFGIIREAVKYKYYSVISTNGHFLSEKHCNAITASGLNRLIVSLDGTDSESYSLYRKGGDFEKVIAGINRLCTLKRELKTNQPFVVVQFLVNKTNEHQVHEAVSLVKKLGADVLEYKSMQIYSEKGMDQFKPEGDKFNRYKQAAAKAKKGKDCFRLWSHLVYTSDGVVVPCCFDKIPSHPITISDETSINAWKSKEFMNFRRRVLREEDVPAICQNCNV
jgi:MoaA/NifB/PqqE/SkfB family radical SAM enzyme